MYAGGQSKRKHFLSKDVHNVTHMCITELSTYLLLQRRSNEESRTHCSTQPYQLWNYIWKIHKDRKIQITHHSSRLLSAICKGIKKSQKQISFLWNWVFTLKSFMYWVFAVYIGYLQYTLGICSITLGNCSITLGICSITLGICSITLGICSIHWVFASLHWVFAVLHWVFVKLILGNTKFHLYFLCSINYCISSV